MLTAKKRWLSEFAHTYNKLASHCDIVVASPAGGEAPLDPGSVEAAKGDDESQRFLSEKQNLWKSTERLEDFKGKANEFDAIFFVGGHGRKSKTFPSSYSTLEICCLLRYRDQYSFVVYQLIVNILVLWFRNVSVPMPCTPGEVADRVLSNQQCTIWPCHPYPTK